MVEPVPRAIFSWCRLRNVRKSVDFPATVQAAIGGLPLAAGVAAGDLILTVAVLAILITAPLGAFGIDSLHKRLLALD